MKPQSDPPRGLSAGRTYEDGLRVAYRFACDMIDPGRKTIPQTKEFFAGVEWAAREMISCIAAKLSEGLPTPQPEGTSHATNPPRSQGA